MRIRCVPVALSPEVGVVVLKFLKIFAGSTRADRLGTIEAY
jgi:hypothetical protein